MRMCSVKRSIIILSLLLSYSFAQADTSSNATACDIDQGVSRPGATFLFSRWIRRGSCVHSAKSDTECNNILEATLGTLNQRQQLEYSAASNILALLPTIGALFGTPTAEIWMLTTILPIGGVLAMLLSFGGSIMPSKLTDYESTLNGGNDSTWSKRSSSDDNMSKESAQADAIGETVLKHMNNKYRTSLPHGKVALSLITMGLFFAGAQAGMVIVVLGSVYSTWCQAQWWLHVWYIIVTSFTFFDNWLNLPFAKQLNLYLTNIPYQTHVEHGEVIGQYLHPNEAEGDSASVALALKQLNALRCGSLSINGSRSTTQPRTAMLITVSVPYNTSGTPVWLTGLKFFSKAGSITIFVFATSVFANVALLAMPMAQMILMLVLGAGIGSRVLASATVSSLRECVPILPLMTSSEDELYEVIKAIFALQRKQNDFQIELDGHIFVQEQRILRRNPWLRRVFGVFATPYDVRKAVGNVFDEAQPRKSRAVTWPRFTK